MTSTSIMMNDDGEIFVNTTRSLKIYLLLRENCWMMRVNLKIMMVTTTSSLVKGLRKWSLRVALPSSDEPWGRGVNNSDPWQAGNSMKMNFGCYFWRSGGSRVYKLRIIDARWKFFEDSTLGRLEG